MPVHAHNAEFFFPDVYSAWEEKKVGGGPPVNAAKLRHNLANHEDF